MSATSPVTSARAHPATARPRARRRFPWFRALLVLGILAVAALFEPHCFRFAFEKLLRFEAWRCGVKAHMRAVEGSIFGPVIVRDSLWMNESIRGPISRVEVRTARADFSWRHVFSRRSAPFFRELAVDGLSGKIELPVEAPAAAADDRGFQLPRPQGRWLPYPERVLAKHVNLLFQNEADYVRLEDASFTVSEVEPGSISVERLAIKQPWLNRTFYKVQGVTKLDESKAEFASIALDPDVQLQSIAANLTQLARGQLNLELALAAFGGDIRIETQTLRTEGPLTFEASGSFSQIGIGKLATFLGLSDAAGGTINKGQFSFRGAPHDPTKATAWLRLDATNFQWESRQWDSLVLGASLLNGRVQIPDLTLHQGHNYVTLSGDLALPAPAQRWWQRDFAFTIAAKIENFTELSALLLPEFKYAAGQATIDGAVRGKDQQFSGQIIVAGSNLTWRSAPIDDLHATLKLDGNELQLTNLSIFNEGDYVRGRGVVNILGDKQYWGELRASIDDLGKYSALLQKPIVPEPLAGGAVIDWSGEGSAKGHSGKFSARLRKLRSLGASAALLHPINADLGGTYAPGSMVFSEFGLSDDESSLAANVTVGNKALSLQGIRFRHRGQLELEGDALLPLDVWKAWPNTSLDTLLDPGTASRVALTAHQLDLHALAQLSGFVFPIRGMVTGTLRAEGPLGAIQSSGKLALAAGVIPLGWSGISLTNVEGEASFQSQMMEVTRFAAENPLGDFKATGTVDFQNPRDPVFQLALRSPQLRVLLHDLPGVALAAAFEGRVEGPSTSALIRGTARPSKIGLGEVNHHPLHTDPDPGHSDSRKALGGIDVTWLWSDAAGRQIPALFRWRAEPWDAWRFDVACETGGPGEIKTAGIERIALRLTGTGAAPLLQGEVTFANLPVVSSDCALLVKAGSLSWRGEHVLIEARCEGWLYREPFSAEVVGPIERPARFFDFGPPLTAEMIREHLTASRSRPPFESPAAFTLSVPRALAGGSEIFDWPQIVVPEASPADGAASVPAAF